MGKGKIKKSLHKPEGAVKQSSQMGAAKLDAPFLFTPFSILPPGQDILVEPEGPENEQVAKLEQSLDKTIGLQKTDNSLTGQKRGLDVSAKDLRLKRKRLKIHKIRIPFLDEGEKEIESGGGEVRDIPG